MANPSADFPTAIHTNTDVSANSTSALGATSPTHTQLEGKQEEEITAIQTKIGIGASPAASATDGQVLTVQADGTTAWEDAASGSGDVSKVGTPVDNQIGVWTGDGTIEGDAALTFDTTTDTLSVGASGNFAFGAVTILADSAGTTTLQNIDAIDATTEATLEAAIDSLVNLTTVGTITTGVWNGTDIAVADGGTGASTASGARTNLGLAIGSDVQAWDAQLDDIAALVPASNLIVGDGLGNWTTITPANFITDNNILDTADIGVSVQAYDAGLASIAGLTTAADKMIYTTASDTYAVTDLTAFARTLLDDSDAGTARTTLGLVAGGTGDIWVEKAGDAMTGGLSITGSSDVVQLDITGNATQSTNYIAEFNTSSLLAAYFDGSGDFHFPKGTGIASVTFIGGAGKSTSTGIENIGIGQNALLGVTTGLRNIAIGQSVMQLTTTTSYNVGIGPSALRNNTGNNNVALGYQSLYTNTTGSRNFALGTQALLNNSTGNDNVAIGNQALLSTTSSQNVGIGYQAGYSNTSGYGNVMIGYQAGFSQTTGLYNVFIGWNAGRNETGSNKLYIDNTTTATPLVYGEFNNDLLIFHGDVSIKPDLTNKVFEVLNDGSDKIAFFGATAAVQASAYTPTNVSTDRSYDANSTTVHEIADVLGTLISDLQTYGLLA